MNTQAVLSRFGKKTNLPFIEIQGKYLALVEYLRHGGGDCPPDIDPLWHEMILDTEFYAAWCDANFGKFVHHRPKLGTCKNPGDPGCNKLICDAPRNDIAA